METLKSLVAIKTEVKIEDNTIVRENYDKIAEKIHDIALNLGLKTEIVDLKDSYGEIPTVLVSLHIDKPTIAFPSHYDVVPAGERWILDKGFSMNPYEPIVKDGKIYGRGAADDKSAIVSSLAALEELSNNRNLRYKPVLIISGDEEVGGTGIRLLLDKGYRWDKVVILDADAEYLSIGASGVVHGWIKVKGTAGHAGFPHKSVNPVDYLIKIMYEMNNIFKPYRASKLSRFNSPPGSIIPKIWGRFTFTIVKLGKNDTEKHNRIPSEAVAGFDMRLLPEEDVESAISQLYSYFSKIISSNINATLEITNSQKGWYSRDTAFVDEALKAVKKSYESIGVQKEVFAAAELGGNDGSFFDEKGMPVVAFGALREECNFHAPREFVYIKDLILLKNFVKYILT